MFELLDFNENPNVGVYCRANDAVVFLQKQLLKKVKKKISAALDVKLVELSIADSTIIGSLLALNSNGVIVTSVVGTETLNTIREQDLNFYVVKDVINAAGNDILANDYGALIHPDIKSYSLKKIEKTLGVSVQEELLLLLKQLVWLQLSPTKDVFVIQK